MNRIKKMNAALKEKRERGEVVSGENNLIKKAKAYPASKIKAIAATCFHCFGGTIDEMPEPGWKNIIRTCTSPSCPLFPHRPYR